MQLLRSDHLHGPIYGSYIWLPGPTGLEWQHACRTNQHETPSAACIDCVPAMQLLGINCLRVPFSFQTLWRVAPGSKAVSCNPASQADVRANVIPPGTRVPSSVKMPGLVCPVPIPMPSIFTVAVTCSWKSSTTWLSDVHGQPG